MLTNCCSISQLSFGATPQCLGTYSCWKKKINDSYNLDTPCCVVPIIHVQIDEWKWNICKLVVIIMYDDENNNWIEKCTYFKFGHEVLGSMGRYNNVTGSWCYKTFINSIVHECQQWIVVTIHVQQPHLYSLFTTFYSHFYSNKH